MKLRPVLLSWAATTALASAAHAQSIDYGRMERLFGEPVTDSATGSPQKVTEAPVNMQIISADDIRRSGADNIPDILSFVAGLDVRRYGFSHAEVSARGYNQAFSPRLLVLINGRQVYDDTYGYTVWSSLPVQLDEIRQIEVIKGPNSALFGFNAVGGVINIITYDPLLDSKNTLTVRGGTQGDADASAVATAHLGSEAGLRLSAETAHADGFSSENATASQYKTILSMDGRVKLAPTVEATLEATSTHARYADLSNGLSAEAGDYGTNSVKAGIAAGTSLGLFDVVAYRNESTLTGGSDTLTNDVYVVQANDQFKLDADNTVRIGLEYRNNSASSEAFFGGHVGYDDYAASGMWNWQITPALALTNSVRFDYLTLNYSGTLAPANSRYTEADYNDATMSTVGFNSGLVYKLSEEDTVRLMAARGIQAPSLIDFGTQATIPVGQQTFSLVSNPNTKPSVIMNYEVDYDRKITAIDSTLRLAAYHQKTEDLIGSPINVLTSATSAVNYGSNFGSSTAIGSELGLSGKNGPVRWSASYALEYITDHFTFDTQSAQSAGPWDFNKGTPTSKVTLGFGYSWDKFEFDMQCRWQSSYTDYSGSSLQGIQPVRISDYITANARLGYNITDDVTLAVSGQQLNQSRIDETAGYAVERRVLGSVTAKF